MDVKQLPKVVNALKVRDEIYLSTLGKFFVDETNSIVGLNQTFVSCPGTLSRHLGGGLKSSGGFQSGGETTSYTIEEDTVIDNLANTSTIWGLGTVLYASGNKLVGTITGTFVIDEVVTGGTSLATGKVASQGGSGAAAYIFVCNVQGTFQVETVTGATASIAVTAVTGPSATDRSKGFLQILRHSNHPLGEKYWKLILDTNTDTLSFLNLALASPTIQGTVGAGTGLTLPAHTSGQVTFSNASPFTIVNGKVLTVTVTAQTVGVAVLTIPNFANVSDTFAFLTLSQTLANKTLTSPTINGTVATTGLVMPNFALTDILLKRISEAQVDIRNLADDAYRDIGARDFRPQAGGVKCDYTPSYWDTKAENDSLIQVRAMTNGTPPVYTNLLLLSSGAAAFAQFGAGTKLGLFGVAVTAQQAHIADPTGGATIDAEARTAIAALNVRLETIGINATV